jgi:hypothetical protein
MPQDALESLYKGSNKIANAALMDKKKTLTFL